MTISVIHGDCRAVLADMPADSVDAVVTDPPYHLASIVKRFGAASLGDDTQTSDRSRRGADGYARLATGFMGKEWDGGSVAFDTDTWRAVYRVLRPGGHMLAFGGTRTSHRMVCAIEDAGFEVRDTLCWIYGQGFPKSLDVSKAIDRAAGAVREVVAERYTVKRIKPGATVVAEGAWGKQDIPYTATDTAPATPEAAQWAGWGTALKPAYEPIVLCRKPLSERNVAANVLRHGTGAINVDACRVAHGGDVNLDLVQNCRTGQDGHTVTLNVPGHSQPTYNTAGRWPANIIHDGSDEVEAAFAAFGTTTSTDRVRCNGPDAGNVPFTSAPDGIRLSYGHADTGSASRFFYSAKATASDRADSKHPTVKPVELLRWLVRMITPPGGTVLDPFAGSGTTGEAAMLEGFNAALIEQDVGSVADIRHRINRWSGADAPLFKAASE